MSSNSKLFFNRGVEKTIQIKMQIESNDLIELLVRLIYKLFNKIVDIIIIKNYKYDKHLLKSYHLKAEELAMSRI